MVSRPLLTSVLVLWLGIGAAWGESERLAKAREAIARVRYDDAQGLLVEALRSGTSSPDELAELYKLSASTAVVLGQADVAEQYYRRWLALVPTASLDDSVAPKLRQPFVAAQAYMAAHGRLSASSVRRERTVDVVIESDPLGMVAAVALGDTPPHPISADRLVHLDLPPSDAALPSVRVLDEFGNRLFELPVESTPSGEREPERGEPASPLEVPLYRRPLVWGVAASVFAVGGIAFGLAARSAQADVVAIAAEPGGHFASELDDARQRRDRDAVIANIGFVTAGACAIGAAATWLTRPRPTHSLVVAPVASGATLVLTGTF